MASSIDETERSSTPTPGDDSSRIKNRAIQGMGWTTFQVLGGRLMSLIVFVVLARILSPADIGLVGLALLLVDFLQMFATQGFFDAVIQRKTIDDEHLDTAFWANVFVGSLFTAASIFAAPYLANLLGEPRVAPVFQWLALEFVALSVMGVYRAVMQRQLSFDLPAILLVAGDMIGGIAGIIAALCGFGVWSLVILQLTAKVVTLLMFAISSTWQPGLRFSFQALAELYSFGLSMIVNKILAFCNRRLTDLLIQQFFGVAVLGLFNVANRILVTFSQVAFGIVRPVAFAAISRMQHDPVRVRGAFFAGTQFLALFCFPIFAGFALVADDAVRFFFGPRWDDAIVLIRVLTVPVLIQSVVLTLAAVTLQATGRPSLSIVLDGIYGLVQVAGFFLVTTLGGKPLDVAFMFAATSLLILPLALWLVKKQIDFSIGEYVKQIISPALVTLFMSLAVLGVDMVLPADLPHVVTLAAKAAAGMLTFAICLPLIDRALFRRVLEIAKVLKSRRSAAAPTP